MKKERKNNYKSNRDEVDNRRPGGDLPSVTELAVTLGNLVFPQDFFYALTICQTVE